MKVVGALTAGPARPVRTLLGNPLGNVLRNVAFALVRLAVTMVGAATAAFVTLNLLSADPVRAVLGQAPATPDMVRRIRQELGLDRPLAVRYVSYLARLFHGDLGISYQQGQPVTEIIGGRVLSTFELAASALALALCGAAALALVTTGRRWRWPRSASNLAELVVLSTPAFWIGVLLLTAFSFRLRLFPAVADEGG